MFYSAIVGARKYGIDDLSISGRVKALWEMFVFDYNIQMESFRTWCIFTYIKILQFLGRAPSMEKIKEIIAEQEKRYFVRKLNQYLILFSMVMSC